MAVKNKKAIKKSLAKKTAKKKIRHSPVKNKAKNQELLGDIIFDSKVGKTDALFVENPQPAEQIANPPRVEETLEEALKEFDALEKTQEPNQKPQVQKKSFWQKLFKI
jgi:hypothetical protein